MKFHMIVRSINLAVIFCSFCWFPTALSRRPNGMSISASLSLHRLLIRKSSLSCLAGLHINFTNTFDQGTVLPHLRHLGGRPSSAHTFIPEGQIRVRACNAGWRNLGKVWFKALPHTFKRPLFLCSVQPALLTGLESYVLSKVDYRTFDTTLQKKIRAMRSSTLYRKHPHCNTACTVHALLKWIDIVSCEIELRVRRLKH